MKLRKVLNIIEMVEEKRVPHDMVEPFYYHSRSGGEPIMIHEMDVVHIVRAFKNALHRLDNQYKETQ